MDQEIIALTLTAASIGFIHTVLGPDHYLPFVGISRARQWSMPKTVLITVICGIGHVASSIVLGLIGVALGIGVAKLKVIESVRGDLAAWALIAFGLVYAVWGIRKAMKKHSHSHLNKSVGKGNLTPWILFTVFVLGPCEPLIPILMYPAAQKSTSGMIMISSVFAVVTITTMTTVVLILTRSSKTIKTGGLGRYSHALAGMVIFLCGLAIQFGL